LDLTHGVILRCVLDAINLLHLKPSGWRHGLNEERARWELRLRWKLQAS
jgi:hypothetical protein